MQAWNVNRLCSSVWKVQGLLASEDTHCPRGPGVPLFPGAWDHAGAGISLLANNPMYRWERFLVRHMVGVVCDWLERQAPAAVGEQGGHWSRCRGQRGVFSCIFAASGVGEHLRGKAMYRVRQMGLT